MFTLITGAHVYAPEDLGIKDVLICNDRIVKVADHIDFEWDEDDFLKIEGSGKILTPGFIDQHVHIIGGGGEDGFASLIREIQMSDCVRYGVTTVVGVLGTDNNAKSVETLVARAKALKEQGMSAYCLTGSYAYPSSTLTGSVSRDIAFIEEVIGVKIAISDHRSSNISKEELARLATQARTAGLLAKKPGVVHMHTGWGKKGYKDVIDIVDETDIPISQFRPTHVSENQPYFREFALKGGYVDFTSGIRTDETAKRIAEALKDVNPKQITLSSDSNGSFPKWSHDMKIIGMGVGKMETLFDTVRHLINDQGIPVSLAISFITQNVAEALMLYPKKGCIQKDSDADIVLLDENLNIDTVLALGKVMVKDGARTAENYYDYQ